jgi:hypothetical protein
MVLLDKLLRTKTRRPRSKIKNLKRQPDREKMHMSHTTIPRRTVLLGATAVGLGAAGGFRIPTGEARAPIVSGQVPYLGAERNLPRGS